MRKLHKNSFQHSFACLFRFHCIIYVSIQTHEDIVSPSHIQQIVNVDSYPFAIRSNYMRASFTDSKNSTGNRSSLSNHIIITNSLFHQFISTATNRSADICHSPGSDLFNVYTNLLFLTPNKLVSSHPILHPNAAPQRVRHNVY